MSKTVYMIRWGELNDAYLYGAHIEEVKGGIYYEQNKMPPGAVIKTWHMQENFQAARKEPSLPYLLADHQYHMCMHLTATPANSCFLRLNFFNYQGNLIDYFMTSDHISHFTIPKNTYTYTMELIKGNCDKLLFERIDLYESLDLPKASAKEDHLDILALEPQGSMLKIPDQKILDRFDNLLVILDRRDPKQIQNINKAHFKKIRIFGYGSRSNQMVKMLLKDIPNAKGYIYHEEKETMHSYGNPQGHQDPSRLCEKSYRLSQLPFIKAGE